MSQLSPSSLGDLTDTATPASWRTEIVLPKIGGGKLDRTALTFLESQPDATALRISGLDQTAFEALVEDYGKQFTGLHFWKCPRIEDLTPLETLPQLTHVAFFWNQRTKKLWDLTATPNLLGLEVSDFTRLRSLDDLAHAQTLEELMIGDKVWSKNDVDSLEPLAGLANLRSLGVLVRKVTDGRVQALARLPQLRLLHSATNLWTTEQCAWLRAHLPDSAEGRVLEPIVDYAESLNGAGVTDEDRKDVLVVGKRKPWLHSEKDADRIARYVNNYWAMVERFRQDPTLDP